jgi:adenine-specific DNA methylase
LIPKECKRLIEVDFPVARVSMFALDEKKIFRDHPQGLHQWWARRPLAACRAVLLGLILPDPCDPACPSEFKKEARKILESLLMTTEDDGELQTSLLKFIGDFANWDKANDQQYLRIGKALVKASYPEEMPLVVDPFAGGGAIPLEALRLDCDVFASDLNPVACLILKALLEYIPRDGPELAEHLQDIGTSVIKQASEELSQFYPTDSNGSLPIAYLWARAIRCESPNCGGEIPLIRSMWLSTKTGRKYALRVSSIKTTNEPPDLRIEVVSPQSDQDVLAPIVSKAKATCPHCGMVQDSSIVRRQLAQQRGGTRVIFDSNGKRVGGALGLAVVCTSSDRKGREYRSFEQTDNQSVWKATVALDRMSTEVIDGFSILPEESINPVRPSPNARGLSAVTRYGMLEFSDLYTARQLLMMTTLCRLIRQRTDCPEPLKVLLAFVVSRMADRHSSLVGWYSGGESTDHVFRRQALPMRWDFAEASPFTNSSGSLSNVLLQIVATVKASNVGSRVAGTVELADACSHPLPDDSAGIWFTDPPYYDSVPYADLADYFYVWLKRVIPDHPLIKDPFDASNPLTPKVQECVWNRGHRVDGRPKDARFFEQCTSIAFSEGARILVDGGIGCVVFAHKTTEGWESLLSGMIRGGFVITASWPILTERGGRILAQNTAALSASVHLVCRPRPDSAPVGDWAEVLRELPKRVGAWMERLHNEGVRGADLVFACIGPALEIYSQYSRVETAEGHIVELPEYLSKVWEIVGRKALENVLGTAEARARNGAAGALEEDARLTALFLWTLQSTAINGGEDTEDAYDDDDEQEKESAKKKGGYSLVFDVVRRFSQPLGIDLPKWEGRIIEIEKGVVRLLPVHERATQLFGDEGAQAMADRIEDRQRGPVQMKLFLDEGAEPPEIKGRTRGRKAKGDVSDEALKARHEATTLDKVHAAMLLQDSGRTNALRALIEAEQQRGPEFMRLANALSALYPAKSEEKRLLDAMILSAPR